MITNVIASVSHRGVCETVFLQREIVSSKNFDPLLANSSVNVRRPASLGDNNSNLLTTGAVTGLIHQVSAILGF